MINITKRLMYEDLVEKMKKTKLIIITIIILLIILSIVTFFYFKNVNTNFPDYEKYDIEKLEEIYNTSNKIPNDFVTDNLINYQGLHSPVYIVTVLKKQLKMEWIEPLNLDLS